MKNIIEYFIIGISAILLFYLLSLIEAFELIFEWSRQYENYELDELILILPVSIFVLSVSVFRKRHESRQLNQELQHIRDCNRQESEAHRKAQLALRKSENEYQELVQNANSIILKLTPEGRVTFINRYGQKFFGWSEDKIVGQQIVGTIVPESETTGRDMKSYMNELCRNPNAFSNNENENLKQNGDRVWISWTNKALFDEEGARQGILCIGNDITEYKRTQDDLKESEEKFRKISTHAQEAIIMMDPEGKISFWNKAAETIFGYSKQEAMGNDLHSLIVPQRYRSEFHNGFKKFLQTGKGPAVGKILELIGQKKDATEFPLELSISSVRLKDKWNAIGIIRDITDRKQAEDRLRESVKRFKQFLNHSPAVTFIKDLDGKYIYFSQRYFDIWGEQAKEWIGKSDGELWSPEVARQYRENDADILKNEEPIEVIETWETPEGQTEWLTHKFPVRDYSGKLKYLAGTAVNITEQKQLETQLRRAQKMESIGILAGGIAHDFNNILAAIIGFAEIAIDKSTHDLTIHDNLNEILNAGYRARDLVTQILTFSRQSKQELKPIQPKLIVKEAIKMLRATMPTTIEITQNIKSDAHILADATQIHQILINICSNASDAMLEGGGKLEISLDDEELDAEFTLRHHGSSTGPHQRLSIRDKGPGMAPEIMEQIFDPFFTTKDKTRGTGMGLAVVHGAVKSNNGFISIYSEPGQGTKFDIYFPIVDSFKKSEEKMECVISKGSERILFIDDEKALVNLGKLMLEEHGYMVTTRTSSVEALELFKAKPDAFDIVITDMTMPNMTGMELIDRLTQIRPDIPVMLVSGFSPLVNEEKAKAAGIHAFLTKPVLKTEILSKMRQVLDQTIVH